MRYVSTIYAHPSQHCSYNKYIQRNGSILLSQSLVTTLALFGGGAGTKTFGWSGLSRDITYTCHGEGNGRRTGILRETYDRRAVTNDHSIRMDKNRAGEEVKTHEIEGMTGSL